MKAKLAEKKAEIAEREGKAPEVEKSRNTPQDGVEN